jgi:hypothetical protein
LKAAIYYLNRVAAWVWQGCRLFSGPLLAIGVPLVAAWLWPTEFGFRSVGFLLQVLGVWIVWVGIRGTREQFEVPGSWAQTKAWMSSFPRVRGRVILASGSAIVSLSGMSARAHVWSGVPEGATVEQRLEAVEKNVRRVRDDLSAHQKEADDRVRAQDEVMKRERAEREAADKEIHEKIKETETGGLKLNAAGVWWLLSGTVCSTFPEEIAYMVRGA